MANYIPKGWHCSPEGAQRYRELRDVIETLIARRVRKYKVAERADLLQEARLAALYAVDSYQDGRGKLINYIGVVVSNALAMVASELLAQCRQPYRHELRDGEWVRIPAHHLPIDAAHSLPSAPGRGLIAIVEARRVLDAMDPDARALAQLRFSPPAEFSVMARNLRRRRPEHVVAAFLGWPLERVEQAKVRCRQVLQELE